MIYKDDPDNNIVSLEKRLVEKREHQKILHDQLIQEHLVFIRKFLDEEIITLGRQIGDKDFAEEIIVNFLSDIVTYYEIIEKKPAE